MTTTSLARGVVVPGWGRLGGCAGKRVEARGRETENCGAKKIKSTAVTTVTKALVFPEHITISLHGGVGGLLCACL